MGANKKAMDKIHVVVDIDNIKDWNVNWSNDGEGRYQLKVLEHKIIHSLCRGLGIDSKDLSVDIKYESAP